MSARPWLWLRSGDFFKVQLTNIARDLGEDARAGRLYLPLTWLAEAGIAAQRDFVAQTLGKLPADDLAELDRLVLSWRDLARAVDEG